MCNYYNYVFKNLTQHFHQQIHITIVNQCKIKIIKILLYFEELLGVITPTPF